MATSLKKQREHLLRITRLVDNILDEAKITEGKLLLELEEFDLCEMVTNVLERFKVLVQTSNIGIIFNPKQSITGKWDRFRMEQVFINLLINAIRYGNKKPIEIEVFQENQNAHLIVRDQGIGIQIKDQQRIFERFERANPADEINGLGLGLYISENIISAHKGEIKLKSEFEKGSEFTIIIPVNS
ncbi:MAG: HAMP domain-containing histidine kinase [Bdellovibrionales bacterium]|nr:HAMP domain-containing histidine kinase [Bdellovibrionales bacterium]